MQKQEGEEGHLQANKTSVRHFLQKHTKSIRQPKDTRSLAKLLQEEFLAVEKLSRKSLATRNIAVHLHPRAYDDK